MNQCERDKKLEEHIRNEHNMSPVSAHLKEVIYGGVDGIITTFAIVAGFSGAALSNETTTQLSFVFVLLFGFANLFADGVSMGLGNFLSVRSEQSQYRSLRKDEQNEAERDEVSEIEETHAILRGKGFSDEDSRTLASIYRKNKSYWLDFMMTHELKISDPRHENPLYTALATFFSFLCFGIIPLIPFIALKTGEPHIAFLLSSSATILSLVVLGILKWRVIGNNFVSSVLEIVFIGGIAAGVAFFVGSLFTI